MVCWESSDRARIQLENPRISRKTLKKKHVYNLVSYNARGLFNTDTNKKQTNKTNRRWSIYNEYVCFQRTLASQQNRRNLEIPLWKHHPSQNHGLVNLSLTAQSPSLVSRRPFAKTEMKEEAECVCMSNNIPGRRRTDLERPDLEFVWIEIFYKKPPFLPVVAIDRQLLLLLFTIC